MHLHRLQQHVGVLEHEHNLDPENVLHVLEHVVHHDVINCILLVCYVRVKLHTHTHTHTEFG